MPISNKESNVIFHFITKVYREYITDINEYIQNIKSNPKKNRLQFISNFINKITLKIIDSANETQLIKNVVLPDNNISINKKGKFLFVVKIIDSIDNMESCQEFGSIFSIIDNTSKDILMSGCLHYSYLVELVLAKKKTAELYTFNENSFIKTKNIKTPKIGNTYIANEGKQKLWKEYHINQYLDKIKINHNLVYNKSLISNFFHILLKGGVLLCPSDLENPNGYIELVFEALPMAFIINNSGGIAKDKKTDILNIKFPSTKKKIKQTTNFILGSQNELDIYNNVINPSLVYFD